MQNKYVIKENYKRKKINAMVKKIKEEIEIL
jgi:hypothetical protein